MNWMWLAVVQDAEAHAAYAAAPAWWLDGMPAGVLAAWPAAFRPKVPAVKIDARIVDRDGAGAEVSLALAPPGVRLLFDDTAVQQARRDVIAGRPPRALSTLLRGDSIFAGAVTIDPAGDDPFARIFPARRLRVGPGLFGRVAAHPAPTSNVTAAAPRGRTRCSTRPMRADSPCPERAGCPERLTSVGAQGSRLG